MTSNYFPVPAGRDTNGIMSSREPEKHVLTGFPDTALRFYRAMERNRRRVAQAHGLSEMELRALFRIGAAGAITPKQLALDLAVTNGALTGISTRLVTGGQVRRVAHPGDRRSLHLELTTAGHEIMRLIHEDFRAMLATDGIVPGAAEIDAATRVLDALTDQMTDELDRQA